MEDICKFQMSKFLSGSRDYQVVVRAQTIEEFKQALIDIKPIVEGIENASPKKVEQVPSNLAGFCQLHKRDMKSKMGQYGEFWSHFHEDEQGNKWWCDGKKLKPAKTV